MLERQKSEMAELDAMIGRQSTDIGERRRQALEALQRPSEAPKAPEPTPLVDPIEFAGKPKEFDAYLRKIAREERERERAAENAAMQRLSAAENQTRKIVTDKYGDFEKHLDTMAEVAREVGGTSDNIALLKARPYAFDPAILNLLYVAAKARTPASTQASAPVAPKRVNTGSIGKLQGTQTPSTVRKQSLTVADVSKLDRQTLKEQLAKRLRR